MPDITPFLWFDSEAEEAAEHYVAIFPNSRITSASRYGEVGPGQKGKVMTISFELDGKPFTALNGGPMFQFTEAVSFFIHCKDQDEVDHYWERLSQGGQPGRCGWLKDRFGLSWQVVPDVLPRLLGDPDPGRSARAMQAMMQMSKIDIAALQRAAVG